MMKLVARMMKLEARMMSKKLSVSTYIFTTKLCKRN